MLQPAHDNKESRRGEEALIDECGERVDEDDQPTPGRYHHSSQGGAFDRAERTDVDSQIVKPRRPLRQHRRWTCSSFQGVKPLADQQGHLRAAAVCPARRPGGIGVRASRFDEHGWRTLSVQP